jgi:general secretion pathway protein A
MYEDYYGFAEKPFSLTPDPRYLYRSPSHASALELLQYAIRRREGFVVVTGDIGTGKTTLCRALLEQIDRTTYTALVLNPFLSEDDLLRRVLQDFGVATRDELRSGRLAGACKETLIDLLYDFLLGLVAERATAVLIIDEAQNLPPQVLEQIRILSNLETDKDKLLQIILVGQLNLRQILRAPEMRQLDQRVSIRYQLTPLDQGGVTAYVIHRLAIAGGTAGVSFSTPALKTVYRLSEGIPRLINLICDRALLAGFSLRTNRITPELVARAAGSLDLERSAAARRRWNGLRPTLATTAAALTLTAALSAAATGYLYSRVGATVDRHQPAAPSTTPAPAPFAPAAESRELPAQAAVTILAGSYPVADPASAEIVGELTDWLEASGFHVYYAEVDLGSRGRWRRVLAGSYTDPAEARRQAARINKAAPQLDAVVVPAAFATGRASRT